MRGDLVAGCARDERVLLSFSFPLCFSFRFQFFRKICEEFGRKMNAKSSRFTDEWVVILRSSLATKEGDRRRYAGTLLCAFQTFSIVLILSEFGLIVET